MYLYNIFPASNKYKSALPLTYSSLDKLLRGQLVTITLRSQLIAGVVDGLAEGNVHRQIKSIVSASSLPPVPNELIDLAKWIADYYNSGIGPAIKLLVSLDYLKTPKGVTNSINYSVVNTTTLPKLTKEQSSAIANIGSKSTYILHGETGSGKTRVYLELAKKAISNNTSVIILTPEIGLTAQLEAFFGPQFPGKVLVTHSNLTISEKRYIWRAIILSKEPIIVIGPRSALFAPIKSVGLIIIDESHDSSYKQTDSPHYQSSIVAGKLRQLHNCPLILGSATPSINDYYLAIKKHRPIIKMRKLAVNPNTTPPKTILVDLKNPANFSKSKYLSNSLIDAIKGALRNHEQALLFLNRRGTARTVICNNCGFVATCPNCGLPLTYHADKFLLLCHNCNFRMEALTTCPVCQSTDLAYKSIGSKAIESEIIKLFPNAKVQRFDSDNLKSEKLEKIYDEVKNGKIDIIIGTQTIAKGLDLPKLSVVGIVIADTGLFLPDYNADEKTYELIRQVLGRVGRGHRYGQAVVQTYNPKNSIINWALSGDYESYYSNEIQQRERYLFPPTCYLAKFEITRATRSSAERTAIKFRDTLLDSKLKISIDGPSPSFHEIRKNHFCWQLILKSKNRNELVKAKALASNGWKLELDPISLL